MKFDYIGQPDIILPKCEAKVQEITLKWRKKCRSGSPLCGTTAKYEIDGKHYCKTHAGTIALEYLTTPPQETE